MLERVRVGNCFYILFCLVLEKVRVGNFFLHFTCPCDREGAGGTFFIHLFHGQRLTRGGTLKKSYLEMPKKGAAIPTTNVLIWCGLTKHTQDTEMGLILP